MWSRLISVALLAIALGVWQQGMIFDISMLIFCVVMAAILFVIAIAIVRYRNRRP